MESNVKLLNAIRYAGGIILTVGIIIFLRGFFESGSTVTAIGIGAAMGAIFIFLMGVFFVATEEMLEKRFKGIKEG